MNKRYINLLRFFLFLGLGIFLLRLTFRNQDIGAQVDEVVAADYTWALPVLFFSLLCYAVRVLRWKMLARPLGYDPPFRHALMALSAGYFVNIAVPRLGELTRCAILRRTDKIPFNNLLGTVVMERIIDILSLLLVILLALAMRFRLLKDFFVSNVADPIYRNYFQRAWSGFFFTLLFLLLITLLVMLFVFVLRRYRNNRYMAALRRLGRELWDGMKSIALMRNKWKFIGYTIVIWSCYVMMTYFWFFAFEATSRLGIADAFAIMAVGTIGRSVPVQGGGAGAYHFLVANLVLLFGISEHYGISLAIIIHGGQTIFTILMGLLSMPGLYLAWRKPVDAHIPAVQEDQGKNIRV